MTDAERLVECLRTIGFDVELRPADYVEEFRGLAEPKPIKQRVNVGCHFLFDDEGKLVGVQSEYDGWVSSVSAESISVVGYRTQKFDGLGSRVVAVDLLFRDATHARELLSVGEYRDNTCGRSVYVLPGAPSVRQEGVIHTLHFRHVAST